jgi:hypothetical protein
VRDGSSRVGADRVSCGGGRDVVIADRHDRVARDCEVVRGRWAASAPSDAERRRTPPPNGAPDAITARSSRGCRVGCGRRAS